ncbi:MAG TPA: ATPase [Prevotella sp.]|uniref:ATP-binding protein n=2 Tax=Segatella copri TaxID=165179 RepID=A0AB35ZG75_9BACT|nr:ATP-binding protein [Segatella copri]HAW83386.1 ATPase [Prevotella sp.]MQN45073.1 ATP-binding protein [Segatella copri]MQN64791.1 ATP-binding protein [Segatella copri]MQN71038.1 ATP-binding protein [Segatella copri]
MTSGGYKASFISYICNQITNIEVKMVLEIRLSNMFSFRDEVTLDLQAAKIQTKKARELEGNLFSVDGEQMLKSVALFGANASGKSNVIKAIRACVNMVRSSHNYNVDTRFAISPFKFEDYANKPSSFYIRFLLNGVEYEYSFSFIHDEIITETLYYYPNGRKSLVFRRDESRGTEKKDIYEFKTVIKRPFDVADNTSKKTLYISRASQMDREIAQKIFLFFCNDIVLDYQVANIDSLDNLFKERKEQMLEVLRTADSDIIDFKIQNNAITTFHRTNPSVAFDFETEESEGTKTLFRMMVRMIGIIHEGKMLLVDEIDNSLHTQLVEFVIGMFNHSNHAQLIYTIHNTHLLNTDFQRRDQVYFVNKREDGSSDLYSLFDFKDFRDTLDMEKAYLQGRFDAIPTISNLTI